MGAEHEVPNLALDVLGILWEIDSRKLVIAHTENARTIQKAVEWLQNHGYIECIKDDIWKITDNGDRYFVEQSEREA